MLATMLQQWARRYIRTTQLPRRTPQKRAHIRAFFANGVDRFHVAWAVEALPTLVHLSLFLFFAGLLVFLFNINHAIFIPVVCWARLSLVIYACITLLPIFWHDSPYRAPLSSVAWLLYTTPPYFFFAALTSIPFNFHHTHSTWDHLCELRDRFRDKLLGGIEKAAEDTASERALEINGRIVEWTVDALSEDDALERFLKAIPGFYQPGVEVHLPREVQQRIDVAAGKFLNRTFSSGSICKSVVDRRLTTCLNAAEVVGGSSGVANVLRTMVFGSWHGGLQAVEIGHFLISWVKSKGMTVTMEVRCIVALIIKGVRERDDRWKALALDHLDNLDNIDMSESKLEKYLAHGDSVLLANLVSVVRQLTNSDWDWTPLGALEILSILDIDNTLAAVRGEFCYTWNHLHRKVLEYPKYSAPERVLNTIHHLFITVHRSHTTPGIAFSNPTCFTDVLLDPEPYPWCRGHGILLNYTGEAPAILTMPFPPFPPPDRCKFLLNNPDPEDVSAMTCPARPHESSEPLRSSRSNQTISPTGNESSPSDLHPHISTSPHSPLLVPEANPVQSLEADIPVTTQATNEYKAVPLTPTESSSHSGASYIHSSTGLTCMRRSPRPATDRHVISPFNSPGMSTSISLPHSLPGNTQFSDLQPLTTTSASQAANNQTPPQRETSFPTLNQKRPTV